MKYYIRNDTLFLRGSFSAASTGPCGGLRQVSTVVLHSPRIPHDVYSDPCREAALQVTGEGLSPDYFGLVAGNDIRRLFILQYDYITVFIVAYSGSWSTPDKISVVAYSGEGLAENAIVQMIATVTSAKARALVDAGLPLTAATDDHIIVAAEGEQGHADAGPQSDTGWRVSECIQFGLPRALQAGTNNAGPALYVYSRLGGGHFVLWNPRECPYYPCHFPGQRCDYCYCPFYPCKDETLGQWVDSSNGGRVWNCSHCTLLHIPGNADYLKRYPEAALEELKKRGN